MKRAIAFVLVLSAMALAADQPADVAKLSDEFDQSKTLTNWQHVFQVEKSGADQLKRVAIDAKTGKLTLEPFASSWYQDYRGVMLFKPVTGDFVVTTTIAPHGKAGGAPRSLYSLAGIMIRTPRDVTPQTWRPGGENYAFLSCGAADKPGTYQMEVKTTINSVSKLEISPGAAEVELRSARIGSAIIMLKRLPNEQWTVHRRYPRGDMPETLQVGITCYTDWSSCERLQPAEHNRTVIRGGNPDLIAEVDYVRFRAPAVPADLAGKDLSDPRQASDEQLLSFLGDAADGK